jgi:hypothetical protein
MERGVITEVVGAHHYKLYHWNPSQKVGTFRNSSKTLICNGGIGLPYGNDYCGRYMLVSKFKEVKG